MALDPQTIAMLRQRGILPQQPPPQPMGGMAAGQQRPMPPPPMQRPPMPQQPMRAPPPQRAPMPRAMPQQAAMRAPAGPSMPPGAGTIRGADIDIATPTPPREMPSAPATPSFSGHAADVGADFEAGFQSVQNAKDAKAKRKAAAGAAAPASSPAATPSPSSPSTIQAADLDTGGPPPRAIDPRTLAMLQQQGWLGGQSGAPAAPADTPQGLPTSARDAAAWSGALGAGQGAPPDLPPGAVPPGMQRQGPPPGSLPSAYAGAPGPNAHAAPEGMPLHAEAPASPKPEAKATEDVGWKGGGGSAERQGGGDFVGLPQSHAGLSEMSTVSPQVREQSLAALKQEQEAAIGKRVERPSPTGGFPIADYEGGALGAEREANRDIGQQYLRDAAQFQLSSNEEARRAADTRQKLGQHLEEQAKLDDAANRGIDPDRFMKNAGVGRRIGLAIAAGLGAFGASLTHGQNWAMQHIEKRIDNDIEAQKIEVEQAGHRAAAHRSDYGQKLQLLGDPNAAEAAAKADQFAYAAAKAKYEGTQTNDRILKSRADTMAADFAGKAAMYNQETHRLVQTGAADPALKRMREIRDHSGGTVTVDEARRQATAEELSAYGQTRVEGTYPKPVKGGSQQSQQLTHVDTALSQLDRLIALRRKAGGGSLSTEERAEGQAIAAELRGHVAGGVGLKLSRYAVEEMKHGVPEDPLSLRDPWSAVTGQDPTLARLVATKQSLMQQRAAMAPGGGAQAAPPDSGDEYTHEAGGDEK